MSLINDAVNAAVGALPLLKAAIDSHEQRIIDDALTDFRQRLMEVVIQASAQVEKNLELTGELREATEEARRLKEELTRRQAVRLVVVGSTGVMAYEPVELRDGEAPHHLCQACFDAGVRMVLQPWNRALICPADQRHTITVRQAEVNPVGNRNHWT